MRSGKDVGRNRGELRDSHAKAESGHRVEQEEDEVLRASHQGETPDPEDRDDRTEHEDPSAADTIREPAAEKISRHHAPGAEGEEPDHGGLRKAAVHRVSDLVCGHDLKADHSERGHRERRPEPHAP